MKRNVSFIAGAWFVNCKRGWNYRGNYIYIVGLSGKPIILHTCTCILNLRKLTVTFKGDVIGKVGNTSDVAGKPTHLHYSIETLFPYIWLYDSKSIEGWKKMFYLNPVKELNLPANLLQAIMKQ